MNPSSRILCAMLLSGMSACAAPVAAHLTGTPLASRSGDGGRMKFTEIRPADSGLINENPYDDPAMWSSRYPEFQGGAIGTGIAAGDIDGDGWVDLYVVNKVRPNQLFRQIAPFQFEDITATAGVAGGQAWQTGVTMADIENDGDLDLYVCQVGAPNQLFINDGTGRFTEEAAARGLDLISASVVGAFADYDRDGHLDVYVITNVLDAASDEDGEPDHLYRNDGDGTFTNVTEAAGLQAQPGRGHSATWFDANEDGWPDLYVANDFAVPDCLYSNNGDGTFTNTADRDLPTTPWFAMGADFGDINNDGRTDLFVADMAGTTHFKSKVTMGDMGGLVDAMDRLTTPQYMRNHLFLNSGTDRFMEIAQMAGVRSSDWSWSPRFEDLDNDGWLDLHITNGMVRSFIDSDLVNATKRMTSPRQAMRLIRNSPPLAETHLMLRNDGDLHFDPVQADWGLDHTAVSFGSTFADFDHDGDLDLAYINFDASVSLYRNDSAHGNRLMLQLEGTTSNSYGIGAKVSIFPYPPLDLNNIGVVTRHLGVARGALSSSEPVVHIGLGGMDAVGARIEWPSGHVQTLQRLVVNQRYTITEPAGPPRFTITPDAASDSIRGGFHSEYPGKHPAVVSRSDQTEWFTETAAERGLDFINRERVFNDMERQSLLPNRMNALGGGLAVGDADGDDDPDVFFAGGAGQASALYLNDGTGNFAMTADPQPWDGHAELEQMSPLWFDLDGDDDNDLLVSSGGTEADAGSAAHHNQLYLNQGDGTFIGADPQLMDPLASSSSVVTAGDYDQDGDLDIFIGGRVVPGEYPVAPVSQLLENRQGRLVDVTSDALRAIGMVTAALWTDVDEDDRIDLLVVGEWMSPTVFSYDGTTLTENTAVTGFADHSGWWNSLHAWDVDRDGDLDYLAGNAGLNTKYHANQHHPVSIYYADFEDTGRCEIVEAEYEGDHLFPVRGRSCSSRAMPSLAEKFPTFRDFGLALLPEIYTPEKLAESLHVSVTELASGIFVNEGHGHYTFQPFARRGQTAPIFGLASTSHFFLAVQNFHGPQVETGWHNGGIGFLGTGNPNSVHIHPSTGISIPGEARGAASGDFDGDGREEFIVTRINEPILHYQSVADVHYSTTVKLRGRPGNPDAIGAVVTLETESWLVSRLIAAGSGYLSQSEPGASFPLVDDGAARNFEVVWPDGIRSTHTIDSPAPLLEFTHPAVGSAHAAR